MTNVLELIRTTFADCAIARESIRELEQMPLASNCGADCKRAIEAAQPLVDLIRAGHGPYAPEHVQPLCDTVVSLCLLYICG